MIQETPAYLLIRYRTLLLSVACGMLDGENVAFLSDTYGTHGPGNYPS